MRGNLFLLWASAVGLASSPPSRYILMVVVAVVAVPAAVTAVAAVAFELCFFHRMGGSHPYRAYDRLRTSTRYPGPPWGKPATQRYLEL